MKDSVFTMRLSKAELKRMRSLAKDFGMKPAQLMRGFINGEITQMVDDNRLERVVRKVMKGSVK